LRKSFHDFFPRFYLIANCVPVGGGFLDRFALRRAARSILVPVFSATTLRDGPSARSIRRLRRQGVPFIRPPRDAAPRRPCAAPWQRHALYLLSNRGFEHIAIAIMAHIF
jgi:hypothetical protein